MANTITIKKRWDRTIIFSHTCEDNTYVKTIYEAIKQGISLKGANLSFMDLSNIDLYGINLSRADFTCSCLNNANLSGAILTGTNFDGATVTNVDFTNVKGLNDQCPKTGSFIGWKKCLDVFGNEYIVKLEIPANARRCSAINSGVNIKCRCSQAKVLEIQNIDGTIADVKEVYSWYDKNFVYRVNEYIYPDWFDGNFWNECGHGIHFFMKREEAVNW